MYSRKSDKKLWKREKGKGEWEREGNRLMKSTKVQTLCGYIGIFGLKTTFHAYVLGEHTSMKNEL